MERRWTGSGSDNVELVRNVYEKLIGEDLAGFLRMCAEDAEVVHPRVEQIPWCGSWRGHEAIERSARGAGCR
jgi:ketosteroid isomerase-like protein